jgi:hypothetical protein
VLTSNKVPNIEYYNYCECPEDTPIRCTTTNACVANVTACGQCSTCPLNPYLCAPSADECCPSGMKWCETAQQCIVEATVCCPINASIKCAASGECVNNSAECPDACTVCENNGLCITSSSDSNACCDAGLNGFGSAGFYCTTLRQCISSFQMNDCPCPPGQVRCQDTSECVANVSQCGTPCEICSDQPSNKQNIIQLTTYRSLCAQG